MADDSSGVHYMRESDIPQRKVPPLCAPRRIAVDHDLQKYIHVLGPKPKRCLETLVDLGMSDSEIARYLKVPMGLITTLRRIWGICADS